MLFWFMESLLEQYSHVEMREAFFPNLSWQDSYYGNEENAYKGASNCCVVAIEEWNSVEES